MHRDQGPHTKQCKHIIKAIGSTTQGARRGLFLSQKIGVHHTSLSLSGDEDGDA